MSEQEYPLGVQASQILLKGSINPLYLALFDNARFPLRSPRMDRTLFLTLSFV